MEVATFASRDESTPESLSEGAFTIASLLKEWNVNRLSVFQPWRQSAIDKRASLAGDTSVGFQCGAMELRMKIRQWLKIALLDQPKCLCERQEMIGDGVEVRYKADLEGGFVVRLVDVRNDVDMQAC